MIQLKLLTHSQENGEVHLEVTHDAGLAKVVINRDNVPLLLMTFLTALRVGGYPSDVLDAAAMSCAATLSTRLAVRR
jgi:hypothetical protein